MNKNRRKKIEKLVFQIERAIINIEAAKEELLEIQSEEQDYFDNMPENMQEGDKGNAAQEAADMLQSAVDNLEESVISANEAIENAKQSTEL